jgi:hypothetical protein
VTSQEKTERTEPKERLKSLSSGIDTMRLKKKELFARHEARRLREAASRTKGERKARPL